MREIGDRASCFRCGRATYDPARGERPWARGVAHGDVVLVCPECQTESSDWIGRLDRCPRCGSTRLGITLGLVVCRSCGDSRS